MADADSLLQPISDAAPCGPDLVAEFDGEFLNFRDRIEAMLPERFAGGRFMREDGLPFEPREIKISTEKKAIDALLERSRDIRFVLIEARLYLLTGRLQDFAARLDAIAQLLDRHWEHVHPTDPMSRRAELEGFEPPSSGPIPLQFVPLVRDKRAGAIRYRDYMIATGEITSPEGESTPDETTILGALADEANKAAVDALCETLDAIKGHFSAISTIMSERGGSSTVPKTSAFLGALARIRALVTEARGEEAEPAKAAEDAAASGTATAPATTANLSALATIPIGSHGEAAAALVAAERYFTRLEPSAPSLLLVHQARKLIGRPLLEALQALAPDLVASAKLGIAGPPGFELEISRLQTLSEAALADRVELEIEPQAPNAEDESRFEAQTRERAAGLIASVEAYFLLAEPSSPVPLLLARARDLLGKDFTTLMPQIFPSLRSN
ncbi:type VI secretion system protein TssA [Jiella marina]|uniref:type VI secretion system protein TssA n=1 Tax=Jiella sp. LLJ827 TaxID=2917712 RepID=UPI002100A8C9|nr:type VI secretion system ImpA family N-terminal domain-containing protein [Jiella sp. LLJ827]MCQ0989522.1 type VI secretion system ImpA family N-terminal domain-containing protein [Jiella sp. LLJ827]